jgi:hypothetical protein
MKKLTHLLIIFLTAAFGFTTQAQTCYQQLGSASNILSTVGNRPHQLIVNNDLNTVIFIHRNDASVLGGDNGVFRYDISNDNGTTWQLNQGYLNPSSTAGVNGGRYPEVALYNPAANTDVTQSTLVYHGPTVGSVFSGYVSGAQMLDGSSSPTEHYNQSGVTDTYIPGGMCQSAPGTFWTVDAIFDGNTNIYGNGFRILKGTYAGGDVTWSVGATLTPPFNTDIFGSPAIADWNMAFDPSGQYGWVVLLTHLNGLSDYNYHPVFYNTSDGGATWSGPVQLDLMTFSSITSLEPNPGSGFEAGITVDMNGHPHALIGVFPSASNYSVYLGPPGNLFDFTFDGTNWNANHLAPLTFQQTNLPTVVSTNNRLQATRSDDGSKIVFTYVESDASSGYLPTLKAITYDVPSGSISCPIPYSQKCPSDLNGQMYLTAASPNMIQEGGVYKVPVVLSLLNPYSGSGSDPAQFYYLDAFTFTTRDFSSAAPYYPTITADADNVCYGTGVTLTADDNSSYLWSTGETTKSIIVYYPGTYTVVNPDLGFCIGASNSATVNIIYPPYVYAAGPNIICAGAEVTLYAQYYSIGNTFEWSTGETTPTITVSTAGTYSVTVDGCASQFPVEIFTAAGPANDNICNASPLTLGFYSPFDNTCATVEPGEQSPGAGTSGNSCQSQDGWCAFETGLQNTVWFKFTAPASGAVTATTYFDNWPYDTQLALWEAPSGCSGALTLVAANDDRSDTLGQFYSEIQPVYCLKKGATYYLQVDGYFGQTGTGSIIVSEVPDKKVFVCHKQGRKTSTIQISGCALPAHLAHGDALGACPSFKTEDEILNAETDVHSYAEAYPNPFSDKTTIEFGVDNASDNVKLEVFTVTGQKVAVLFEGSMAEGEVRKTEFTAANAAAEVFIYVLKTDSEVHIGKLNLLK